MFVVISGGMFLREFGLYHSTWVNDRYSAKHFDSKAEADITAYALAARVQTVSNVS